jgi:hypothetical protein
VLAVGYAPIEENVDDDAVEEIPEGHKGVPEREAMRFGERCSEHEDEESQGHHHHWIYIIDDRRQVNHSFLRGHLCSRPFAVLWVTSKSITKATKTFQTFRNFLCLE